MKDLRILIGRHYGLEAKHVTSMMLDSILPILKTKFNVKIIWLFYMSERTVLEIVPDLNTEILDIHDFNNAVEVLEKAKPDLVIDNEYPSLIDLAIDQAAKLHGIPVLTRMLAVDNLKISKKQFLTSFFPMFFYSSMPYEKRPKKQFMRRGRFFIYKFIFLFKTWRACKLNWLKIIHYFLIIVNWHISNKPFIDPRFANTLHFLESEILIDRMLKRGFSREKLVITGNPIYDEALKKYSNDKHKRTMDKKIRILFAPIQHYEGGFWTRKERDFTIREIIKTISNHKDEFSLIVKLHPSSQLYDDYESVIHEVDASIPIYQKGGIQDYLDNVDLVVSFSPIGSALIYPLIAQKPLVLCNFIDFKYENKIEEGVAWECKIPSQLIPTIQTALSSYPKYRKNVQEYLRKFIYETDGRASERLCDAITRLVKKG